MHPSGFSALSTALFAAYLSSPICGQDLTDSSGFALRSNGSCQGSSTCGETFDVFNACCPNTSTCIKQYNDICCPSQNNCTDALVQQPRCADPTWTMCNNNGYFCCLPEYICYSTGNGGTDGCGEPGYKLKNGEYKVSTVSQVPFTSTPAPSASASPSSSPAPSSSALDTSDKIAIGIGVPVGVATIAGTYFAWRMYRRKYHSKNQGVSGNRKHELVLQGRIQGFPMLKEGS